MTQLAGRPVMRLRRRALTAAAVAALFAAGCGAGPGNAGPGSSSTTPTTNGGASCVPAAEGLMSCYAPGRPLRRRRRRGLLLPVDDHHRGDEARMEYASVASFAELGLKLMALGAPQGLVVRCHRAAIDEIGHAATLDRLAGHPDTPFGAIPHLLGRRVGSRFRSRRRHLADVAAESYRDGWLNEGASAADFAARAAIARSPEEGSAFGRIAADERRHAELARDVVLWCFEESPQSVGRALARL